MSATEAKIAAWQKAVGIEPAKGGHADILEALSKAAFEAIKVIELERSGIRDGDGCWHGGIDTVGKKGVLLLGRFTEGRIAVLERLREELRKRGYVPIAFNFDKPETKDFTETVRLLAGLSRFVIADVTNPKSAPLELQATVPEIMVPFLPIIEEGQEPFAMLTDLWIKHRDWVFEPVYHSSLAALVRRSTRRLSDRPRSGVTNSSSGRPRR